MKIKFLSALMASSLLIFTQCKKDDGGGDPPATVTKDYSPVTTGSTFTYRDSTIVAAGTNVKSYTLTVTGGDTTVNGKKYYKLSGSDTSVRYKAKVSANYYQLTSLQGLGIGLFEDNYLNDSLAVNDTWSQTTSPFVIPGGGGFTATATLKYKIASKAGSLSVNGTTYGDVINVQLASLTVVASGLPFTINATGSYYYAKGFGLIQGSLDIPAQSITIPIVGTSIPIPQYTLYQKLTASDIK